MAPDTLKIQEIPAGEQVPSGHIALARYEVDELRPMNRAQRRRWLRENRVGFGLPKSKSRR